MTTLFQRILGIVGATLLAGIIAVQTDCEGRAAGKSAAITKKIEPAAKSGEPQRRVFCGKVVLLRKALQRRKIKAFSEFDKQVVLETPTGELIPIVPDWRGRAFYQDKRLRNRRVQLVGYRHQGVPYLQVLMVFTFDKKNVRQYTDYWCDLCSIPMYEIKPCDCCQETIRLRFQPKNLPTYVKEPSRTSLLPGRKSSG
ncbi:MAG: hypothetical protein IID45_07755, partial [Planctomycetes bacterium]|nr:hypothetical protein [Planctomycetota bacterium]